MKFRCPVCKNLIQQPLEGAMEDFKYFPFCSERCKLVDLGAWLDGEYRLAGHAKLPQISEEPSLDDEI